MKKSRIVSMLLSCFALFSTVGCKPPEDLQEEFVDDGQPYEIVYYMIYNEANPPENYYPVQAQLNKILKEKINATIKLVPYTLSEYSSKLSGVIAAGTKFDVCFTSPDLNPYLTNVQREAFMPLDYLLPTYAPETYAAIPEEIWEQTRVGGKIYGAVNEQIFPRTFGYNARSATNLKDFLDAEYDGISPDQVYLAQPNALQFLEEYLEWLKLNERGAGGKISSIDTDSILQCYYGFENLGTGMTTPGVVRIKDGSYKVVNQFETEEYQEMINTVYDFKEKGYLDEGVTGYDLSPDSTWKPGYKVGNLVRLSESNYFCSYVIGSMNAISSTSKNPARAMKFIELMRTDEEVHNLLQYGIEDLNYIKDPNNPKRIAEFIEGSGYNNYNFGWGLGTEFISYLQEGQEDNQWEQVKKINQETEVSPFIGFNFDVGSLKQKIADCKATVNEYKTAFEQAQFKDKDAKYSEFIARLKAAGADEIIAEKQRQLDEFLAKKGLK